MITKVCTKCGIEKELSEFPKRQNKILKDSVKTICKSCKNLYQRSLNRKKKIQNNHRCKFCSNLILKDSETCSPCQRKLNNFIESYKRQIYKKQIEKMELSNISVHDKKMNCKQIYKYLFRISNRIFYSQYKNLIDKEFIKKRGWKNAGTSKIL